MKCTNCGAALSCGCQKRVASDGKAVCSSCVAAYEAGLGKNKISTSGTKPNNVNVFYKAPKN